MKLGLSKRRHLPVLKLGELSVPIWEFHKLREVERTGLNLDPISAAVLMYELPKGYYLPPFSLERKTVLDIGACCGETAWYFLKHGAAKVVCIECDVKRVELLEENSRKLHMNIEVVASPFKSEHLLIPHDFIKCDIEGYEMELLPYAKQLKPCVVEVHTLWIMDQFLKNGFFKLTEPSSENAVVSTCMMANYPSKANVR